ncbi:MAG: hypothetical protein P1V36_14470 [Planctomycetota bacterium]|nr:hypothetical protein [Planctomycetota bacterium]
MNRLLMNHILKSLGVTLVVAGILFGMSVSWSAMEGIRALWAAAAVVFLAFFIGAFVTAALEDAGGRPADAPTAFQVGLRTAVMLAAIACVPMLLVDFVSAMPFLLWWVVQLAAQLALHFLHLRRDDPDEVAEHLDTK